METPEAHRECGQVLREDTRYNHDVLSSEEREELFRVYVKELQKERDAAELKRKREEYRCVPRDSEAG